MSVRDASLDVSVASVCRHCCRTSVRRGGLRPRLLNHQHAGAIAPVREATVAQALRSGTPTCQAKHVRRANGDGRRANPRVRAAKLIMSCMWRTPRGKRVKRPAIDVSNISHRCRRHVRTRRCRMQISQCGTLGRRCVVPVGRREVRGAAWGSTALSPVNARFTARVVARS